MPKQLELDLSFAPTERKSWLVDCLCPRPCADCYDPREDPNRRLDWGDYPSDNRVGLTEQVPSPPQATSPPTFDVDESANGKIRA